MTSLSREIVFLIVQSLDKEKFKETIHKLEQESGLYFNIRYFEELVINGDWDEVEKYLSGFTKFDDNKYSRKIFFEIRKQKYLEALDRNDQAKAVDILKKDLVVFSSFDENIFKELTLLLMLENFRENKQLSKYGDTKSARRNLFHELELLIEANPLFHDKLNFPDLNSRLQTLIGQSFNWQHLFHDYPKTIADTETPLVDPSCRPLQPIGAQALSTVANPLMGDVPKAGVFSPLGAHGPALAPLPAYLAGRMDSPSFIPHPSASAKPIGFAAFNSGAAILECPGIPPTNNSAVVYQTADSEHVLERLRPSGIPDEKGINQSSADENSGIADESVDKSSIWKLTAINEPSQCRSLRLPDNLIATRVSRLMYTNSGLSILALAANAIHKLWKWPRRDENLTGKATASVVPQLWQPSSGILMTNDISNTNPEDVVPCLALSENDSYVISASGGKVSIYRWMTFEMQRIKTFMPPSPAATFIAFYPLDNNIIAVGMEDSSIQIYHFRLDKVISILNGHQERITGLAFSNVLKVLVSSGADSRICVWGTDGWKKRMSNCLQILVGRATVPLTDTCVQFHQDQSRLLAVHVTQIAIYKAPKLELLNQWAPPKASSALITHATYSCDSQSIYVGFDDGSVAILTASDSLQLRCLINCTCYLPANPSSRIHPLVIAAHPSEPNQFALGLSDGGVCILEPLESEGKWGTSPPRHKNGAGPSNITSESEAEAGLDQPQQ